jgi:uncharacterized protein YjbI with pentapeptide repeats
MGERFGGGERWLGELKAARKELSRAEIEARIIRGENFEGISLADRDISGEDLSGKSFRSSDVRGLTLFEEESGDTTEIKNTDWTDADIADLGSIADFRSVEAEGAKFGFTETLKERRARQEREGKKKEWNDCGGYHNFVGNNGNFQRTTWNNIDLGGGSGYEAAFFDADLIGAVYHGCDLHGMDLSRARLANVRIIDPELLGGMKIYEKYVSDVARGISFTDAESQAEWSAALSEKGEAKALEEYFGIVIVPLED